MSDLPKLTAEELLKGNPALWGRWHWAEIRRRLERLEQCEETLRKSQRIEKEGIQAIASAAAAEERLEQLEKERIDNPLIQQAAHKTSPGISTIPSMQSQAQQHLHIIAAYEQTEVELRERLEKCEAALRKARTLLISEGDPDEDGEMIAEIDELLGDAARAALEE